MDDESDDVVSEDTSYTTTPDYVSGTPSATNANAVGTASNDSLVAALGGVTKIAGTVFGTQAATTSNLLGPYQTYILIGGAALIGIVVLVMATR